MKMKDLKKVVAAEKVALQSRKSISITDDAYTILHEKSAELGISKARLVEHLLFDLDATS